MLDLDAGLKWRGWSLDAEYYFRWLSNFDVTGTIPVTSLFDHGFQVYASTMLKPDYWQAYLSGSKIFGEFGDPWDLALTYFPFGHKEVRINGQALYTDRSAVGYTAIPYVVGGTGWTFHGRCWHLVLRQRTVNLLGPLRSRQHRELYRRQRDCCCVEGCRKVWLESAYVRRDGPPA